MHSAGRPARGLKWSILNAMAGRQQHRTAVQFLQGCEHREPACLGQRSYVVAHLLAANQKSKSLLLLQGPRPEPN